MAEEHSEVQVSSVSEFFTQGLEEIDLNVNDEAEAPEAKNIDQAEGGGDDNAKPDDVDEGMKKAQRRKILMILIVGGGLALVAAGVAVALASGGNSTDSTSNGGASSPSGLEDQADSGREDEATTTSTSTTPLTSTTSTSAESTDTTTACVDLTLEGWRLFSNGYYYRNTTEPLNWTDSRKDCEELGGKLAYRGVRTLENRSEILNDSDTERYNGLWFGLYTNSSSDEDWYWTDDNVASATDIIWGEGEPNNYLSGQECGLIRTLLNFTADDYFCDRTVWGLCERDADGAC